MSIAQNADSERRTQCVPRIAVPRVHLQAWCLCTAHNAYLVRRVVDLECGVSSESLTRALPAGNRPNRNWSKQWGFHIYSGLEQAGAPTQRDNAKWVRHHAAARKFMDKFSLSCTRICSIGSNLPLGLQITNYDCVGIMSEVRSSKKSFPWNEDLVIRAWTVGR